MRKYYSINSGFRKTEDADAAIWVAVSSPDDADLAMLREREGVPDIFIEYLQDADERPRVEREGEWKMTILRIPVVSGDGMMPYRTLPMGVMSRDAGRVITLCSGDCGMLDDFAEHCCRKSIEVSDVAEFTLRMFYSAAYWFLVFLKEMSDSVIGSEKTLGSAIENTELVKLMRIQQSLVFFNTSIKGDVLVLERIMRIYGDGLDPDLAEDVGIELRQADTTAGIYSDILEGTMDAYASIISNNVNGVMKRMSGLSIILIVPTFVASLFGMNVDILLPDNKFAFLIILGIAALLTSLAFLILRRLKWV